ncbi:MAG: DUF1287 domain-containing protein [Saccharospirillaceae bacterium]|nr:DUF1287 domain-containing protein [Saccharospirillaceae bacterium]MCD8531987.1 DUF1287 domain-containing protein [Saccharospirillaceae bacterium]
MMNRIQTLKGLPGVTLLVFTLVTVQVYAGEGSAAAFRQELVAAALQRTTQQVRYDGAYQKIAYPNGDVAPDIGVCTDVVIRSYRALGIDLQRLVHEDMVADFAAYPSRRLWGMTRTDTNIDHRRVPNLQAFFQRNGQTLAVSDNPADYQPGDLVTWMLPGNLPHIGVVSDRYAPGSGRPLIVHNIGAGPVLDDMLFRYRISGHYYYLPQGRGE